MMGAIAQVFGHFMTYPYQVIKARLQQGGPAADKYMGSTLHCTSTIFRKEGIRGFYKGLTANILKVIPNGAICFTVYEQIARGLNSLEEFW